MIRQIIKTRDNSHTLFVPELDEYYHSIHGALQESRHVFINAGLHQILHHEELNILEVGFGTGLNALLTLLESQKHHLRIRYTGIEKYPVRREEVQLLNYDQLTTDTETQTYFRQLHEFSWNEWTAVTSGFSLFKQCIDLKAFSSPAVFDLVYFDAFAPSAQPDLWTVKIFRDIYNSLKPGGILVTYCVKGEVRRNMQAVGFTVEKIPGPPGKREMARAFKPQ